MSDIGLGRAWDAFDAYLFDIDGTLLNCTDAVHYFAFCNTLESIAKQPVTLAGVTAHGNTDIGILRDALVLAQVAEDQWRPGLTEIRDSLCHFVETRNSEVCATALPGVHEVLKHLSSRGARLGVATGNLQRIGEIKLQRAGLSDYFDFAGWSDHYEYRSDVILGAVATVHKRLGSHAEICVLGDTPADVASARTNGLKVIAVATGVHSYETLAQCNPDLCLHGLGELVNSVKPF